MKWAVMLDFGQLLDVYSSFPRVRKTEKSGQMLVSYRLIFKHFRHIQRCVFSIMVNE